MAREPFLINPAGLGESLVVLGVGNPRRSRRQRRRRKAMARRRMPEALRKYWATHRRGRRTRARHNPPRYRARRHTVARHRRARRMHDNVRYVTRYRRRGYHRNRAVRRGVGTGFAIGRPGTWMPAVLSAGSGAVVATVLPRMVVGAQVTTPVVYVIQGGVGLVGATVLGMSGMVRTSTAFFFFVGATVPIVSDLFARFVMPWLGMAAYSYETAAELAELGQEPHYPPTLSAYSYETVGDVADTDETLGVSPGYNVDAMGAGGYGSAAPEAPWARAAFA